MKATIEAARKAQIAWASNPTTRANALLAAAKLFKAEESRLIDSMVSDGLTCAINPMHMGITAENLARKYGVTREEADQFSYQSHQKALKAIASGNFDDETVEVPVTFTTPANGSTAKFISAKP